MLLEVRNLALGLAGQPVWQGVSFSLAAGECLSLSGASGSGKSLLLRAIAGLIPLQAGEVWFRDRSQADWAMPDYRAQVQYVPQRAVLPEGSVEENLRLPFGLQAWRQQPFDLDLAVALLRCLGRDPEFLTKPATALSGGEGQIVALVRSLLIQPSVLLLDEPTAALDRQTTEQVEALIGNWVKDATERACCWVSHDPAQQSRLGDRRFVLSTPQNSRHDLPDH